MSTDAELRSRGRERDPASREDAAAPDATDALVDAVRRMREPEDEQKTRPVGWQGKALGGVVVAAFFLLGVLRRAPGSARWRDDATPSSAATSADGPELRDVSRSGDVGAAPRDFFSIASGYATDKVRGPRDMAACLADPAQCSPARGPAKNKRCRTFHSHFYHTMYQKWLGEKYAGDAAEPFQFLEVGFFRGGGYGAYAEFMPRAEAHSIELNCQKEKAPFKELVDKGLLHCGDASNYHFLLATWEGRMRRPDAPPLKVVIDDGSHMAAHMAQTVFFWFPKLAPGGLLFVEDIEPIQSANRFRTDFLPQILRDLHYCGHTDAVNPNLIGDDRLCFPTLQPLLASVHCEMHICVFERNAEPARGNLTEGELTPPPHALDARRCFGR